MILQSILEKEKKLFTELANELLDKLQAGQYNQAIMEFGSLQCKPKNPNCISCPLQAGCEARKTKRINDLPVKIKSLKIRERFFNYIIVQKDGQVLVNKRGAGDIWENMFDLPLFETENLTDVQDLIRSEDFIRSFGAQVKIKSVSAPVKHILSHQKLQTSFIEIEGFSEQFISKKSWFYVSLNELEKLAQPKLIFHFFENFHKLNT